MSRLRHLLSAALIGLSVLATSFLGCDTASQRAAKTDEPEPPRKKKRKVDATIGDEVDTKALIAWIQDSQREGVANRNPDAFMKIWANDAKLISGRSEVPGPYDRVTPFEGLEKAVRTRAMGRAEGTVVLRYEDEVAKVVGADRVDIRWTGYSEVQLASGASVDKFAEIYRLRRVGGAWRVFENRVWRVASTFDGKTEQVDDAYWAARDEAVVKLSADATSLERIVTLDRAMRYADAYVAALAFTQAEPKSPEAWDWRMMMAMRLRDNDEAIRSAKELRALQPDAPVPGWIEANL